MKKRTARYWLIGVVVLLGAGLIVGGLSVFGLLPRQAGNTYTDPQGRYSMEVDPSWERVETDGTYAQFKVPDPPLQIYLLLIKAGSVDDAFVHAMETLGFDPELLNNGAIAMIGDWQAYTQEDSAGLSYGLAGQLVGENAYVFVARTEKPGIGVQNPTVMQALTTFKITGKQENMINSYAELEAFVQDRVDRLAGSVSAAVVYQDQIVYTYVYGQANPVKEIAADKETIYRYGSMTKPVTATTLMQLVEQGRVNLDAWPGEYIPEFPQHWKVTVRQLLDHSACMADNQRMTDGLIVKPGESFAALEEVFLNYLKAYPDLACEAGKAAVYSNPHYLALARIIEEVSGESYETYVVDHILVPLAMESTHFQVVEADERYAKGQFPAAQTDQLFAQLKAFRGSDQEDIILHRGESFTTIDDFRVLPPWGGLFGTPSDVTHFLRMHMNGGRYGENQILQPESVAAMQAMQYSTSGTPLGFGLSWMIGEDELGKYYHHGGGGHTIETMMRFYPDLGLGVVVMSSVNGSQADRITDGLARAWLNEK